MVNFLYKLTLSQKLIASYIDKPENSTNQTRCTTVQLVVFYGLSKHTK